MQTITDEMIEQLTEEDIRSLPQGSDLRFLYEATGLETVKALLKAVPSQNIYVPRITSIQPLVARYIRQEFNGNNVRELSIKLQRSEASIYKLIQEERK